jgi:GT2 family glycosyltransferase
MVFSATVAPFFSVVVPTHDRPRQLAACLAALARQDYPSGRFEVIVVDDGSAVPPEEALPAHGVFQFLRQAQAGPAAARNRGAAAAGGEYLAFTDDDCLPEPDWLQALAGHLAESDLALGGRVVNGLPENQQSRASQRLTDFLSENWTDQSGATLFYCANNFAGPAPAFRRIGGFCESFPMAGGEDREFCDRWRERGGRLLPAPDAVVRHLHESSFGGFCRQHFNYGRAAFLFRRRRALRLGQHIRLEPASFYVRLLACALTSDTGPGLVFTAALLAVSQAATAAGFIHELVGGPAGCGGA